ncbi:MAG TPA: TetR/AcrR family transcriptional regulator [Polyangia bacterium]
MARPAHANLDETRRRLIEVALPLFAEHGYDGTAVREVASAARVNLSMISHCFGGKRNLYEAAVDEVYRRLGERGRAVMGGTVLANVDDLMAQLYTIARAEREGIRLLVREVLDHGRLKPFTETKHFLPEIEQATRMTAGLVGVSPAQARTASVTIGYLLSRFVIQDDRSLVAAFGVRSVKEAHARAIQTLAVTARALFAAPPHKE